LPIVSFASHVTKVILFKFSRYLFGKGFFI